MSLLDDVSIVVTPNGYKAGELYAVVPTYAEGSDVIDNGDFATDLSDWNITGNDATHTVTWTATGARYQSDTTSPVLGFAQASLEVGKIYKVTCNIAYAVGSGTLRCSIGGVNQTAFTEGFNTRTSVASSFTSLSFLRDSTNVDVIISNVTAKEVTSADMDVTRETAATRVDENGLVNYAEVLGSDLVTNGDFATDLSGWSNKSSTSTWVSGSARVDNSIGNNNSGLFQDIGLILGKTYTLTATLKLISADSDGNFVVLTSNSIGSGQTIIYTGNALVIGGASVTETIEFTTSDSDVSIQLACNATNAVFEIDNVSVKEVTRDNVPRIDYTGGGCPHILAEPERKNEITYSEDFSQSYWTKASPTVEGGFISPDGTENAFKLIETTAESVHAFYNPTFGVNNGDTYTISLFIKYNGRQWFRLWGQFGSTNKEAYFDIENGLLGQKDSGVTSKIEDYGNDWYRISASATSDGTNGRFRGYLALDDGDSFYQGNGTSGAFIWGAQYEQGSYPTSYIPTSGSTVTRNKDIFTRDGIGSLINSEEGVLFVEMAYLNNTGNYKSLSISDGTTDNRVTFENRPVLNQIKAFVNVSGTNVMSSTQTLTDVKEFNKMALKWKQNDFAWWVNGVEIYTDTSGNTFSEDTLNRLAFDRGDGFIQLEGKVKQLQVYNTALTDEQLLQLTGESGTDFYESYAEMAAALTYTIQ